MVCNSGALKRSTLEKALVKVGCYESKTLDLNQFSQLLDIVQAAVDPSALDLGELDKYSSDDNRGFKSSSNAKVLDVPAKDKSVEKSVEEDFDEDDVESSFGVMEIDEEEAAMEVYEELKGASDKVTLKDFLQWDDLQDLLDNDALNRDDLAKAIEQSGLNVDQDENSAIDFQTVCIV